MEVVHPRCCGLDVHKRSISACIVIREQGRTERLERRWGTFTWELEALAQSRSPPLAPEPGSLDCFLARYFSSTQPSKL